MEQNISYVYRHRRLDNNQIFYIGIGRAKNYGRAYVKTKRSNFWNNIINKTKYQIEIIADNLSWCDACELETFLIQEYGRKDLKTGILVNMTDGGDGGFNAIISIETIQKRRLKIIGQKRTEECKKRLSELATGRKHSEETKIKISQIQIGKKQSAALIEKRKLSLIGKKRSIEAKLNMSNSMKGSYNSKEVLLNNIKTTNKNSTHNIISKYKGVYWYKNYSKWKSSLERAGKKYFLGYFDNEEEAYLARVKKINEILK
jgi:hypothetical protein